MDCREVFREIPLFLQDELDERQLRDFLGHIRHCEDCQEELSIQYLVKEGLNRLMDGSTFNLQEELEEVLDRYERTLRAKRIAGWVMWGAQAALAAAMVWIVARVMIL